MPQRVMVTGATDGIGAALVEALADLDYEVVVHGRSQAKVDQMVEQLRSKGASVEGELADLSQPAEVGALASRLVDADKPLDVLINNAGVFLNDLQRNSDGLELTFAINHLGHFQLTLGLLPLLIKAPRPRVVNVSSMAHQSASWRPQLMRGEGSYDGYEAYSFSKLANILFTTELVKRHPELEAYACHPGVISTKLLHAGFSMGGAPLAQGIVTPLYLANAESGLENGGYYDRKRLQRPSAAARNPDYAHQLWETSLRLVEGY